MAEVALASLTVSALTRLAQNLHTDPLPKMFVKLLELRKKNRGQDVLDHNEEEKEPLPEPHLVQEGIRGEEDKGDGGGEEIRQWTDGEDKWMRKRRAGQ